MSPSDKYHRQLTPELAVVLDESLSMVLEITKASSADPGQFLTFRVDVSNVGDMKDAMYEARVARSECEAQEEEQRWQASMAAARAEFQARRDARRA